MLTILASVLFVYGGTTIGSFGIFDTEIVDISGKGLFCSKPPTHPKNLLGTFGTFYYGEVIICGGYNGKSMAFSAECYKFTSETR